MSEPVTSAAGGTGDRESGLTARWVTFGYLFTLYFILGGAETMISPLFPLVREDLDLSESNLAAILAAVAGGIAAFNVIGGAVSRWLSDRSLVRATAVSLAAGMALSAVAPSFWVLLVGQTLLGVAFGIYFPPALASVARLYPDAPGEGHRGVGPGLLVRAGRRGRQCFRRGVPGAGCTSGARCPPHWPSHTCPAGPR